MSRSVWALATSHGFAGAYAATGHGISASVVAGEGGGMQRDYAYSSARRRAHLESPEAVGRRAGDGRGGARACVRLLDVAHVPVRFRRDA